MKVPKKIGCSIRGNVPDKDPKMWLLRIESATISPDKIIKDESPKTTLKVTIPPWGELCLQIYRLDIRRIILSLFRRSRGKRIWTFSGDLLKSNIPVPEPVLFLEIKRGAFVVKNYIATRWICRAQNLDSLALKRDISRSSDLKSKLLSSVDICSRLHNSGFVHGDLKWSNFLYVPGKDSNVVLTDLDFLKRSSSLCFQGRDFARFVLSALERQSDPELEEMLIDRYLRGRNSTSALIEKGIRRRIAGKREKYEGRSIASRKP
jgi:tRNA A-37 threonylcarbamoyl transferase component Bud32